MWPGYLKPRRSSPRKRTPAKPVKRPHYSLPKRRQIILHSRPNHRIIDTVISVSEDVPHTHVPLPIGPKTQRLSVIAQPVRSLRNDLQLTFYRGLGLPIIAVALQIYIR